MLLAIDTSAGSSVAVVDAGRVLGHAEEPGTRRHAELIDVLLRAALAQAGIVPGDIDGVVAGMGPGPFTGLRVGVAAARAFAFGTGSALYPVVSHDAIAWAAPDQVLVVTDARRREVAWSVYDPGVVRLAGPALAMRDGGLDAVAAEHPAARRIDAATVSAASLGLVAEMLLEQGRELGPTEPLYLRAPDVTVSPAR